MMDMLTVILLICVMVWMVKKKFLPRLKKAGQEAASGKEGKAAVMKNETPDFRILSFRSTDFTREDDLAHCVEYELGKAFKELKDNGCRLMGDPFPVVMGENLLIILYYTDGSTADSVEIAG